MFISYPQYEFHMPARVASPGAQHWRMLQLTLDAPWFLLSVDGLDAKSDVGFVQTIFFAWEKDLAAYLPTVDPKAVRGLVCMAPGWKSASGDWTSHEVHRVWLTRAADGGSYLRLGGADGEMLDVGLPADLAGEEIDRTLLFWLRPRWRTVQTPIRKPGRRKRPS